jgi:hypothetical protein
VRFGRSLMLVLVTRDEAKKRKNKKQGVGVFEHSLL